MAENQFRGWYSQVRVKRVVAPSLANCHFSLLALNGLLGAASSTFTAEAEGG
jgi:hypothetical protein